MNMMVLTRPAERHWCLLRLPPGPAAVAEARRQLRAVLADWQARLDADVAVLLTSDLVTSALRDQPGGALALVVRCANGELRVEVHGAAPSLPWPVDSRAAPVPGVLLVATVADEWGRYRTPEGEAAYFTLTCHGERP
jgi:hypothetical protein